MEFDERTGFLYEHEEQIREWAQALHEADRETSRWLRSTVPSRVTQRVEGMGVLVDSADIETGRWPRVMLHRAQWPVGEAGEPEVSIAWELNPGQFAPKMYGPYVGVRVVPGGVAPWVAPTIRSRAPDGYATRSGWWPAFRWLNAAEGWWQEPDRWLDDQVTALCRAWEDLAGHVDLALDAAGE